MRRTDKAGRQASETAHIVGKLFAGCRRIVGQMENQRKHHCRLQILFHAAVFHIFIFEEGITKIGECKLYINKEFKNQTVSNFYNAKTVINGITINCLHVVIEYEDDE